MANPDFGRIFSTNGNKDVINDSDYADGWETIAFEENPSDREFNSITAEQDEKLSFLNTTKPQTWTDSGLVNAYVVDIADSVSFDLFDGFSLSFVPLLTNTGSSTINGPWTDGAKSIRDSAGVAVTSGDLTGRIWLAYSSSDGWFVALNLIKKGGVNYIINGNLDTTIINQRGFGGGQPSAGVYGFDRWKGDTLGTRIEQVVENTEALNELFVISWTGGTGTSDVDGVTGLNSGDSFTLNTSTNFSVIVPTDATKVQVERGSIANDFQYRSKGEELSLCQRYYEKSYTQGATPGDITVLGQATAVVPVSGTTGNIAEFSFKIPKRVIPTIVIYSPQSGLSGRYFNSNAAADGIAGAIRQATSNTSVSQAGTAVTAQDRLSWQWTSDAEI